MKGLSMSKNLSVKVTTRTVGGNKFFEGTVRLPGLQPTKLVKTDGETTFSTRSALYASARSVAKRAGYAGICETKPAKKATV